jgi:hypothetical protein
MIGSKNIRILIGGTFFIVCSAACNQSAKNKQEALYDEEYGKAVALAENLLSDLNLKRNDYKIITIENLVLSGENYEGPQIWKVTFKAREFGHDKMKGKGGEVLIRIDLDTDKASLLGYGE